MTDPDQDVRRVSLRALRGHVQLPFLGTDDEYRVWRAATRGETADEITIAESVRFVESLGTMSPEDVPAAIERLHSTKGFLRTHSTGYAALLDAGLREAIDAKISEGALDRWNNELIGFRMHLSFYETMSPDDPRDRVQYWLDELAECIAARTEGKIAPGMLYLMLMLNEVQDPRAIPFYIGLIEADDSEHTIYYVGYAGLSRAVDVPYSRYHDAAWWRRWWTSGETGLDDDILSIPIPKLAGPNIPNTHVPFPENMDTVEGKVAWMIERFKAGSLDDTYDVALELADQGSPDAIPALIGVVDADNSPNMISRIGGQYLGELTDVRSRPYHDGAWWRRWWEANKDGYPKSASSLTIPTLPKTIYGDVHIPSPDNVDTVEGKIAWMIEQFEAGSLRQAHRVAEELGELGNPELIPVLIGIIDADNDYEAIYSVGAHALREMTGVKYSYFHDGAWWKRWWARNEMGLSEDILNIPIPFIKRTEHGRTHVPFPENMNTLEGKLEFIVDQLEAGATRAVYRTAQEISDHDSPRAIPVLIAVIETDETETIRIQVGHELSVLTRVPIDYSRDGVWWRNWWNTNKHIYPKEVSDLTIPTLQGPPAPPQPEPANAQPQEAEKQPEPAIEQPEEEKVEPPVDPEFVGYPAEDRVVGDNENMRYFLIGPADAHEEPEDGYKLLVILPGGNGNADFFGFGRRIHKNALPEGYIAAQLVAPVWVDDKNRQVWPTRQRAPDEAEFTTEDFIEAVVEEVKELKTIDERYIFSLGWSSSGPPLFSQSMQEDTPITGTFIAMSVFYPTMLPDLANAKGHPYYLYYSPQDDRIPFDAHGHGAETKLREAGAVTLLKSFYGGHGWFGDPFGNINRGIKWLEMLMDR